MYFIPITLVIFTILFLAERAFIKYHLEKFKLLTNVGKIVIEHVEDGTVKVTGASQIMKFFIYLVNKFRKIWWLLSIIIMSINMLVAVLLAALICLFI